MPSSPRSDVLQAIRKAATGGRGKPNFLCELADTLLWDVYLRMRSGHSAPAIAKFLHEQGAAPGDSQESTSKLLLRFRKKIAHLLISSSSPPASPQPEGPLRHPPVGELLRKKDLRKIEELKDRYCRVIEGMLEAAESDPAATNPHLSQHIQALAQLEKATLKIQEDLRKNPVTNTDRNLTAKQRFEAMIKGLPDNGEALIESADRLLEEVEQYILTLEVDENGKYSLRPQSEAERIRNLSLGICGGLSVPPQSGDREDLGRLDFELATGEQRKQDYES